MWRSEVEGRANQVSHSIFVTNFPSGTSAKQLWDICEQYGKVVDSFIPARVSKEGKKFDFVRFSKVKNLEVLIGNLNTVWIDKFKLRFNIARFQRGEKFDGVKKGEHKQHVRVNVPSCFTFSSSFVAAGSNKARPCSFAKQVEDKPVKSFDSMPNLGVVLKDEGFKNVTIIYVGGFWVSVEFLDPHARDGFQKHEDRGDMLFSEDSEDNNLWRKRLYVVTKVEDFIMESFKIIIKGKVYTVRAHEIIGWIPYFMEGENELSSDSEEEVSDKSVSLNDFCSSVKGNGTSGRDSKKERDAKKGFTEEAKSDDPFGI
ncbi:nucleotide-binding alpha-beta plait domain-containing protein, partial [Tanacetum coccineum]